MEPGPGQESNWRLVSALGMVVEEEEEVVEEEELSGDQVFFPRANNCLYSQQIEQTLLQAMAGFEDEEFGEVDNEEKEDEEREEENER